MRRKNDVNNNTAQDDVQTKNKYEGKSNSASAAYEDQFQIKITYFISSFLTRHGLCPKICGAQYE